MYIMHIIKKCTGRPLEKVFICRKKKGHRSPIRPKKCPLAKLDARMTQSALQLLTLGRRLSDKKRRKLLSSHRRRSASPTRRKRPVR